MSSFQIKNDINRFITALDPKNEGKNLTTDNDLYNFNDHIIQKLVLPQIHKLSAQDLAEIKEQYTEIINRVTDKYKNTNYIKAIINIILAFFTFTAGYNKEVARSQKILKDIDLRQSKISNPHEGMKIVNQASKMTSSEFYEHQLKAIPKGFKDDKKHSKNPVNRFKDASESTLFNITSNKNKPYNEKTKSKDNEKSRLLFIENLIGNDKNKESWIEGLQSLITDELASVCWVKLEAGVVADQISNNKNPSYTLEHTDKFNNIDFKAIYSETGEIEKIEVQYKNKADLYFTNSAQEKKLITLNVVKEVQYKNKADLYFTNSAQKKKLITLNAVKVDLSFTATLNEKKELILDNVKIEHTDSLNRVL
jgi:hypothetical protein